MLPAELSCLWSATGVHHWTLVFVIYINSLPSILSSADVFLYGDDTAILCSGKDHIEGEAHLQSLLLKAPQPQWLQEHRLSLNIKKTKLIVFGTGYRLQNVGDMTICLNNTRIELASDFKHLGIVLDSTLSFLINM